MKTSSPTSPSVKSPPALLFIGPPGGGKSTLAMQFPGVWFADCDLNLSGPERFLRTRNKELAYFYDRIPLDDNGNQVPVGDCLQRLFDKLDAAAKDPLVKTIVIDSLTHVNEYIIQHILKRGNKSDMEIRDWTSFKSRFLELLFSHSRNSGKTVIMTVHELIIEEPGKQLGTTVIVGYRPSLNGSITDYFGAFFTDVWRIEARQAPATSASRTEHYIVTGKTPKSDLKNSLGLPHEMPADYKLLEPYLNK